MNNPLYSTKILDYYHNPRYKAVLENTHFIQEVHHASCGDVITWYGQVENGYLTKASFQGNGCIISQATASLLAENVQGKSLDDIRRLTYVDVSALLGIELGPLRLRCALLSLEALLKGIESYA